MNRRDFLKLSTIPLAAFPPALFGASIAKTAHYYERFPLYCDDPETIEELIEYMEAFVDFGGEYNTAYIRPVRGKKREFITYGFVGADSEKNRREMIRYVWSTYRSFLLRSPQRQTLYWRKKPEISRSIGALTPFGDPIVNPVKIITRFRLEPFDTLRRF